MKPLRFLMIGAVLAALAIGTLLTVAAMARTSIDAWRAYVLDEGQQLPKVDAVLVLGTSPYGMRGQDHWTLSHRLDRAAGLWHGGAANRFLVSGSRIDDSYDEAASMRDELMARGVPKEAIELDTLGNRTWDSVLRARYVFGKRRLLIVSQGDHLARAIFLARHIGIEAWGVAARGANYEGVYGEVVRDVTSLVAYYDVVKGPAPAVIAAVRPP
jgi:SanA protein